MKRYDSYKPSGIEWIGEIPSHWKRIRIKHSAICSGGSFIDGDWIESKDISTEGIKYLTSGNIGALQYREQGSGYISEDTFNKLICKEVFPGDILISRLNEPISRACIVPELTERIVTCVDNVIYRPSKDKYEYRYVVYVLNCYPYTDNANLIARGTTMHRISRTTLGGLSIPVPPISEQESIADYLDKKCGEIDRSIAKQQRRIELLEELKHSVITQAVTRGLDPNVPLRDSGIEWIGKIPEHWKIIKTSKVFPKICSGTTPTSSNKDYYSEDGDYWLQTGDLNDGVIIDTSKKVSALAIREHNLKFHPVNSLVIAMYGATIGKLGILNISTATNQACAVLYPSKYMSTRFAFYLYKSAKDSLILMGIGGGQPNISQDIIKQFKISVPPLSEQQAIADYLDKRCTEIDSMIEREKKKIELMQELKQSIITEVVTGKRKVV